jgi:pimeloyl-ACP methyl ester carboxylesterase
VWSPVLGPLSQRCRVFALSLRHFFPEHWDGGGPDFTIAQHVEDVIGFIEALEGTPADLMGHSRGAHIAFRVAQQRPDLLRKLVLAEPGGHRDTPLSPTAAPSAPSPTRTTHDLYAPIAEQVSAGNIERALAMFSEVVVGPGAWSTLPAAMRQTWRDNAYTLLGHVNEQRAPFTREDAESVRVPTLFVGGTSSPDILSTVLHALAAHVPGARVEIVSGAGHFMFEDDPVRFCAAVIGFLAD